MRECPPDARMKFLTQKVFNRLLGCLLLVGMVVPVHAQNQSVYTDSLQNGWQNWSWATVNLANTSPAPHGGTQSISVSSTNYQALYLHHAAQNGALYSGITFWVNGGANGGQSVQVQATRGGTAQVAVTLAPLPANTWRQ